MLDLFMQRDDGQDGRLHIMEQKAGTQIRCSHAKEEHTFLTETEQRHACSRTLQQLIVV